PYNASVTEPGANAGGPRAEAGAADAASSSRAPSAAAAPTTATVPDGAGRDSSARVVLRKGRARPLWFGHPWVYASAIDRVEGAAGPGDAVSLCDHDGRFIGRGFYNPRSQIPVRLLTRQDQP